VIEKPISSVPMWYTLSRGYFGGTRQSGRWSKCPDAERTPGMLSGAWCVKGHRIRCEDITGQFEAGCSAEEIAGPDIYDLPLDLVRRILAFARLA
jgi:uncharacterized protein (DUF433 family)